jgi:hypothetical protein
MRGFEYRDEHYFTHFQPWTIRYIIKRWGGKLDNYRYDLENKLTLYVRDLERKDNGKIKHVKLSIVSELLLDEVFETFEGNERQANAWLSEMYEKYNTEPDVYKNNYWLEETLRMKEELL